jgi:hypothetical protein
VSHKCATIPDGIRHKKDHEVELSVASLQRDPTIEGLEIRQPHLRFDPDGDAAESALGVPGPTVAAAGKRNLGSPERASWKLPMQPLEETNVA